MSCRGSGRTNEKYSTLGDHDEDGNGDDDEDDVDHDYDDDDGGGGGGAIAGQNGVQFICNMMKTFGISA